ncbi:hypothetical protein BC940DRAFT_317530 [Gongronella butleri]|nr:hypothetical protein BC940DRAFT_317530 [Gongronella butleri]
MSSEKDMYEGSRGVYGYRDSGMQKSSSMMHHDMLEDDQLPIAEQYYRMGKRPRDDEHRAKERRQPERRRCRCAVHRCTVYLVFMALIFGGIATFFCWPRTPMVVVSSYAQRQDPQKATQWGITPDKRPWMEGQWLINITLDNHENWIPTHIAKIDFTLLDSLTQQPFAVANVEDLVVPPHTNTILANTNFYVHYSARTEADTTYQDLYHACAQPKQGQDRASINVNMKVVFHYAGILWSSTVIASPPSGGFICPM